MPILQDGYNPNPPPDPTAGKVDGSVRVGGGVSKGLETPCPLLHNHRRRDEKGGTVTEFEAATLAIQQSMLAIQQSTLVMQQVQAAVALLVGAAQIAVVAWGIRAMTRESAKRERHHTERHTEVMAALRQQGQVLETLIRQQSQVFERQGQALERLGQALDRQGQALERQGQVLEALLRRERRENP